MNRSTLIAALAALAFSSAVAAEPIVDRSKYTADQWEAAVDAALDSDTPLPTLIGGTVVNPSDWPASPWVGNCSSTLIGPRVLITAAHCVGNGGAKNFAIGSTRYTSTCTHHPSYRGNSTADWALCLVSQVVEGVPLFESLPATADDVGCAVGKTFTLTGYGCTRWGGGIDGNMRVGTAQVISCPSGTNYDIVTRANVALCSGDSGGGGYTSSALPTRKTIMVNSRSNTTTTSYMPSYGVATFREWANSWASAKGVKLCGLHADATSCRGISDPDPDPDPQPNPCAGAFAEYVAALSQSNERLAALNACMAL